MVLTAAAWAAVAVRLGWTVSLVPTLALVTGLVPLALVDRATFTLPRRLVYLTGAAVAAGVALAAALSPRGGHRAVMAVACAAVLLVAFTLLYVLNPAGLGFGDVRLAPVVGLGLGWLGTSAAVVGALLAFVTAAIVGVALLVSGRGTRKTPLPLGVFLAVGAVLGVLVS